MLVKLLKYDLKWIYKLVIIFYILALVFSLMGRALASIENSLIFNLVSQICFGFAAGMMISSLINNLMRLWARFRRNIYKDEAYLTHTLPVKKSTIYLSKFLAAIITIFTTTAVILICLAICYYSNESIDMIKSMLEIAATAYNSEVVWILIAMFLVVFLEMSFAVIAGYLAIIMGYKSNNSKLTKAVVYGFIFYTIPQPITLVIIYILGLSNPEIMNLFNTVNTINYGIFSSVMYVVIAAYLVYIVAYYMIGKRQFEKGVNVE